MEDPSWEYKGSAASSSDRRERARSAERHSRSRSRGRRSDGGRNDRGSEGRSPHDSDRGGYDRERRSSRERVRARLRNWGLGNS
eukprot:g40395.t1